VTTPEQRVEELFRLMERGSRKSWFKKPKYPLKPALKAAYAAWEGSAEDELIIAALLYGMDGRLAETALKSLDALGFTPRVCALARGDGEEADRARLRTFQAREPGRPAPPLEAYRAMVMGHLGLK